MATGVAAPAALAQAGSIYTCVTPDGRRLTSDRPIRECLAREQQILNRDGSVKGIHPPSLTAEERAEVEARERRIAAERAAQQDAIRRDRNLKARFPDEAAHQRAREAALDTVRDAMASSELRMRVLTSERKPLLDEAEFYKGRRLPAKLQQALDNNAAATEAQRNAIHNQQAELERINRLYDAELAHLKQLWAGAPPGSVQPPANGASAPSLSRASSSKAP